ncbi:MAG: maleylpyruvate isomerase family mycothiol-dependent enzyme, partial [Nocardioidaceae bacterium]
MNAVARQPTAVGLEAKYADAADRFAVAVGWSDPRSPVPGCPGWSVRELVLHLGNMHAWAATIVETGRCAAEQNDAPRSPRSSRGARANRAAQWYRGKAEDLYEVLRHAPPAQPCWTVVDPDGVAGFWARRQLHETTVHLVDLDSACGRATVLDPVVCADGVDEVLAVLLPGRSRQGRPVLLDRPLALVATDTPDRWLLTPGAAGAHAPA